MEYSIIWWIDCHKDCSLTYYYPPRRIHKKFQRTEGNEQYEDYLFGPGGKHRKFCGILDQDDFDDFIEDTCMTAECVKTLGAIGSPAFGPCVVPAISFSDRDGDNYDLGAYVTPVLTTQREKRQYKGPDGWDKLEKEIWEKYS